MLFGGVLFGCVLFLFSEVDGSFRLDYFICWYFVYLILHNYFIHYSFSGVFLVFPSQKTKLSLLKSWLGQKTSAFLPNLYHPFPISSLCRVAPKIVQAGCLPLSNFCACVSDWCGSLNHYSCTWKKNNQHSQDDDRISHIGYQERLCRSWHLNLLPGSHVVLYFDSTFLSWVVYYGYTRPRGCLLFVHLTQMWPRTVTVTVHGQRVTQKNQMDKILSFNLEKSVIQLFLCLISRTKYLN